MRNVHFPRHDKRKKQFILINLLFNKFIFEKISNLEESFYLFILFSVFFLDPELKNRGGKRAAKEKKSGFESKQLISRLVREAAKKCYLFSGH